MNLRLEPFPYLRGGGREVFRGGRGARGGVVLAVAGFDPEFVRMMALVTGTGLLALGVAGGLVWAFFRSLSREEADGEPRLTPRSARLLAAAIASLLLISLLFAAASFGG